MNYRKYLRYAAYAVLICIASGLLFIGAIYIGVFGHLPSTEELAAIQQENASVVYSEDGEIIGKYFAKNRTQVDSGDIPEYILEALVATEDKRFYEHNGVDPKSYFRVIFKTILILKLFLDLTTTVSRKMSFSLALSLPLNTLRA